MKQYFTLQKCPQKGGTQLRLSLRFDTALSLLLHPANYLCSFPAALRTLLQETVAPRYEQLQMTNAMNSCLYSTLSTCYSILWYMLEYYYSSCIKI